jgi:hypothetical protein
MITICARAYAEFIVQCPSQVFTNEQVSFQMTCGEFEIITYNGVLPAWISLNTGTSQVIGAAGAYAGASTAEATATAQAALDEWADAAILAGTLFCESTLDVCPDWTQMQWGVPIQSAGGGAVVSFSPVSTISDSFDSNAISPTGFPPDAGDIRNTGVITYDGHGCDCNLHVELTRDQAVATFGGVLIRPTATLIDIVSFLVQNNPTGVYDIPFSLPDTLGVPTQFEVFVRSINLSPGPGEVHLVGTVTNV